MERLAIAGNIGVGKTTLINKLAERENVCVFQERVDEELLNINRTYINNGNEASDIVEYIMQFQFLAETVVRDLKANHLSDEFEYVFFDRGIFEHTEVFAKTQLDNRKYFRYTGLQEHLLEEMKWKKYDTVILLRDNLSNICDRVRHRNREAEDINREYFEYLSKLNGIYNSVEFERLVEEYSNRVITVDVNGRSEDEVYKAVVFHLEFIEQLKLFDMYSK